MRPNINLHAFVLMPNHVHGIIEINIIADRKGMMLRDISSTSQLFPARNTELVPMVLTSHGPVYRTPFYKTGRQDKGFLPA